MSWSRTAHVWHGDPAFVDVGTDGYDLGEGDARLRSAGLDIGFDEARLRQVTSV
jgi:hypothetical protein